MSLFTDIQEQMTTESLPKVEYNVEEALLLENDLTSLSYAFDKVITMHELLDVCTTEGLTDTFNKVLEANGVSYGYITTEAGLFEKIKSSISTFIQKFLAFMTKWKNKVFSKGRLSKAGALVDKISKNLESNAGTQFSNTDGVKKALKRLGIKYEEQDNKLEVKGAGEVLSKLILKVTSELTGTVDKIYDDGKAKVKTLEDSITADNKVEVQKKVKEVLKDTRDRMSGHARVLEDIALLASAVTRSKEETDAIVKKASDEHMAPHREKADKLEKMANEATKGK